MFKMSGIVRKTRINDKILEDLNKKLYELQKSEQFCDYKLKTENDEHFKVHKWVLSTVSPFFATLFNTQSMFYERHSDSFLLRKVSLDGLEKIIQYIYTGETTISSDKAKEIIDNALFLHLFELVDDAIQVLIETLNSDNCLDLLKYSETCLDYGEELTKRCLELSCEKFDEFVNLPNFFELSPDTIKILIFQKRSTYTEEQLYLAVREWLIHDLKNREEHIETLMTGIHIENFSYKFARTHIFDDDNPLLKVQSFNKKLHEFFMNNWAQLQPTFKRSENLFAFIGKEMFLYNNGKKEFSEFITKMKEYRENFCYTTFDETNIFICGGKIDNKAVTTCTYYSIEKDQWEDLRPMKFPRYDPKSVRLGDKIYVCGGTCRGSFNKSVELFDISRLIWSKSYPLNGVIENLFGTFGLCTLNNCVYFVSRDCVQYLDPRNSNWEILSRSATFKNFVWSSEAYNNSIYGFTDDGISIFDIRKNRWLQTPYKYEVKRGAFPKTCVLNNQIYILSYLEIDGNCSKHQVQTYKLSNLSFCNCHHVTSRTRDYCRALFSL